MSNEKPPFSPTPRDALLLYRLLQVGYCTREQIQLSIFGVGDSANVSMSRRWASMLKLGYIKEKDRLFYATALGVQEVLMKVLNEEPEDLPMVNHSRIPGPPNPGNTKLLFEHHRLTAEAVFHFIERYEGLAQVKHFYVLPTPRLWGGRIKPDSAILLIYEKAFSLFFLEIELGNTREDLKNKLNQYKRYKSGGAFKRDYEDQFHAQYGLPDLDDPFFRVMVICANGKRIEEMISLGFNMENRPDEDAPRADLFRFAATSEISGRLKPQPIWMRPEDKAAEKLRKRWEVE